MRAVDGMMEDATRSQLDEPSSALPEAETRASRVGSPESDPAPSPEGPSASALSDPPTAFPNVERRAWPLQLIRCEARHRQCDPVGIFTGPLDVIGRIGRFAVEARRLIQHLEQTVKADGGTIKGSKFGVSHDISSVRSDMCFEPTVRLDTFRCGPTERQPQSSGRQPEGGFKRAAGAAKFLCGALDFLMPLPRDAL